MIWFTVGFLVAIATRPWYGLGSLWTSRGRGYEPTKRFLAVAAKSASLLRRDVLWVVAWVFFSSAWKGRLPGQVVEYPGKEPD